MADESNAPRRSNRKPKPTQREAIPVAENVPSKRKAKDDVDPAEQLRFMLQNPKSRLTKMDISVRCRLHTRKELNVRGALRTSLMRTLGICFRRIRNPG